MKVNEFIEVPSYFEKMRITPKICRYATVKRIFDIVISSIALFLLAPIFVLIAILVRLSSPGPIIYRSERIGLCGEAFQFPKFRSMYLDSDKNLQNLLAENEKDGPIFKMKRDPRITPVGRFLRKYSLDELPQFISVLRGEMSYDKAGDALIETTMRVANGRLTCAEALGHREFTLTKLYRSA